MVLTIQGTVLGIGNSDMNTTYMIPAPTGLTVQWEYTGIRTLKHRLTHALMGKEAQKTVGTGKAPDPI